MTRLERFAVWISATACLLFAATLRDLRGPSIARPQLAGVSTEPSANEPRGASLRVTVVREAVGATGATTEPAVGASVRLVRIDGRGSGAVASEAANGATDERGVATLELRAAGRYWLLVAHAGSTSVRRFVELAAGERAEEVRLAPAAPLEVVVLDGAERPIGNARVMVHGVEPLAEIAHTDVTGLAAFESGAAPPWAVEIDAQGYGHKLVREVRPGDSPLFVKLERKGTLVVRVRDEHGAPKPEAAVTVAGSALWPSRSATTGALGEVTITELPRGFYDVRAEAGEFVSEPGRGLLLEHGEHKVLEISLIHGRFVRVVVTDGEGDPPISIEDADVVLVEGGLSSFPRFGRTDQHGVVRLGPITDSATVSAYRLGFVPTSAVSVEDGVSEIRVSLLRGAALVGRIVDERGWPIEGASLEVVGAGVDGSPLYESASLSAFRREHFAASLAGPRALIPRGELGVMGLVPNVPLGGLLSLSPMLSDGAWSSRPDGTFLLEPVSPGRVQLVARHPGFVEQTSAAIDLLAGRRAHVEMVLGRGGSLGGRVLEASGHPVAGARIELVPLDGGAERVTYAAEDGRFAFASVPREILVTAARHEAPEHVVARVELSIAPGAEHALELVLPELREPVSLRLVDDRGFSLERGELHVASLDSSRAFTRTLFTNEAGEARLEDARGQALRITARRGGHAPVAVEVEHAPAELTLALGRAITATGEVRSRGGGMIAGAVVTLLVPTGERRTHSDRTGGFSFADLAAGDARILITAEGHAFRERSVVIEARRDRAELGTIELARGATVEGEVVDERGDPVAGARVALGRVPTYLPAGKLPPGVAQTDPRGRFVLRDVESGDATIEAFKWEHGRASLAGLSLRAGDVTRDVRIVLARDAETPQFSGKATLAVSLSEEDGPGIRFAHVPYGGEAQRAGVLAGDRLYRVNGRLVDSIETARRLLDGAPSQDLVLELGRAPDLHWRVRARREQLRR
ncbi:MAG: hypothetical protein EXR75_14830 [Myxococcales bacterium]|nr:hypothetical protein [Myxococcales bacterium]